VIAYADLPPERMRGEEFRVHQEALRELGVEATLKAERRAAEAEVEHETVLVPNTPVDALLALAEERDARFIVIGNHGEGRLLGALLGTLPYKLPSRTQIPVVVVRVHDE
jgi:nucleotide-binding universal stress UspA family protein